MTTHTAVKPSGAAWLGDVPAHWEVKPLWTMYRPKKETGYPKEPLLSVYRDFGVIEKSSRDDNKNRESEDLSSYQLVVKGDLVTNKMKAWQGSIAVSGLRGIVSPAYYVYRKLHGANDSYLHQMFRSAPYITGYQSASKGIRVGQWDLEADKFRLFPVLVPPIKEQEAIVAHLDRATTRIDALITKKTRFIELLREKRRALITRAVTKGLDARTPMRDSEVEWLGKVPAHWDIKKLGFLTTKIGSGKTPQGGATVYVEEGVVFLRSQNVYDDRLRLDDVAYISEETHNEMRVSRVHPGDVLLNITGGSIGRSSIVPPEFGEANVNQHVCIIRFADQAMSIWVHWFFCSHAVKAQVELLQTGAGREGLNFEQVGNFRLAIPPAGERSAIASHLDHAAARIDTLIAKTERSIELLREHRKALITAAVTGKIDLHEVA